MQLLRSSGRPLAGPRTIAIVLGHLGRSRSAASISNRATPSGSRALDRASSSTANFSRRTARPIMLSPPRPFRSSAWSRERASRLVADELALPIDPRVAAMAEAIAAHFGPASRAVLFYGSCLREAYLDGLMLDFYLIVSDYPPPTARLATSPTACCRPTSFRSNTAGSPPNCGAERGRFSSPLRAQDAQRIGLGALRAAVAARLGEATTRATGGRRGRAGRADAACARTLPTCRARRPARMWRAAFALTYGAELRAERNDRSGRSSMPIPHAIAPSPRRACRDRTPPRRVRRPNAPGQAPPRGQAADARAAGQGDADLCRRHRLSRLEDIAPRRSGVTIRPWQRRRPILGAMTLLPRLIRSGAIR